MGGRAEQPGRILEAMRICSYCGLHRSMGPIAPANALALASRAQQVSQAQLDDFRLADFVFHRERNGPCRLVSGVSFLFSAPAQSDFLDPLGFRAWGLCCRYQGVAFKSQWSEVTRNSDLYPQVKW